MGELSPEYDDCPQVCGYGERGNTAYCGECPRRELRDGFREQTEEALTESCGDNWRRFGFENLLRQVLDVLTLDAATGGDAPNATLLAAINLRTASLIDIVRNERHKMRRVDDWNERQRAANDR